MTAPFPAGLGRRDDLDDELARLDVPDPTPARVLAAHGDRWLVAEPTDPAAPRLVPARGRLRDPAHGGPPVTGDWVVLDGAGAIAAVLPRRGTLVRRGAGERTVAQTLAANVELALVVEPLPEPNARRVERFAALAAAGEVPAALVLTKRDLDPDDGACAMRLARRLGLVDALAVTTHADGAALVRPLLAPGSTAVLLGPSGAGKSTLANALLGTERQATGAVRVGDGRGRHTTVARELLRLPSGALLIDTPGLREVGLWDEPAGAFADVEALALRCRFPDCGHATEPGCAVRDAVDPERLAGLAQARARAGVDRRPPRRGARAGAEGPRLRPRAARGATREGGRRLISRPPQSRLGLERRGTANGAAFSRPRQSRLGLERRGTANGAAFSRPRQSRLGLERRGTANGAAFSRPRDWVPGRRAAAPRRRRRRPGSWPDRRRARRGLAPARRCGSRGP